MQIVMGQLPDLLPFLLLVLLVLIPMPVMASPSVPLELSLVWQLVLTPSQLRMVTTVPLMCQLLLQNLLPLLVL